MKEGIKWLTIITLLSITSQLLAVKAKRGVPTTMMTYQDDDFENQKSNLGSEEAVVEKSMQEALQENMKDQNVHQTQVHHHKLQMAHYKNLKNKSMKWIKKLKRARNRQEYEKILKGYKTLVKRFKTKFKGCLPPPPPAPMAQKRAPTESRCHAGFRSGWKHGKQWAILITADKADFNEGLLRINCLTKWLKTKKDSIYSICAMRGALQGYKKWYRLRTHKEELEKYITKKRLRESAVYENIHYYEDVMKKVHQ